MIGSCVFQVSESVPPGPPYDEITPLLYLFLANTEDGSNSDDFKSTKQISMGSCLLKDVSDTISPRLMNLYGLDLALLDYSAFLRNLTKLIADVLFVAPVLHITRQRAHRPVSRNFSFTVQPQTPTTASCAHMTWRTTASWICFCSTLPLIVC